MAKIFYKPLSHQAKFQNSIKPNVVLLGGYGCLPSGSLIQTIDGQIPIEKLLKPTIVRSFDGVRSFWSIASQRIDVGVKKTLRLTHSEGELIVSDSHQIFCADGEYRRGKSLLGQNVVYSRENFSSRLPTIKEFFLSEFLLSDPRLKKISEDFLSYYQAYRHLYDQLLLRALDNAQSIAPQLADVSKSFQYFSPLVLAPLDDLAQLEPLHSHPYRWFLQFYKNHLMIHEDHLDTFSVNRIAALSPECIFEVNQLWRKFLLKKFSHRNERELSQGSLICESGQDEVFSFGPNKSQVTICKVEEIGEMPVYDLHVIGLNNYVSQGMVHHNSGKTHSLVMKCFELMDKNRGLPGGILCPSYKMFKRDLLPSFTDIARRNKVRFKYHGSDHIFNFHDAEAQIYVFHGEDRGASIRGPNLAWGGINEVTLLDKESFDAFLARIRLKTARQRQLVMSGTPEGFDWFYEYFVESPRDDTDLIFGDTRENSYIAADYVERLMQSYDRAMVEQFVEGKFVNLTGNRAAWSFDRFKHTREGVERDLNAYQWVTMDFNLNPMSAVLWNFKPFDKVKLQAWGEIALNDSNTYEIARVIKDRLGESWRECVIYPDPAGNAGSTKSAGKSDIQILKDAGFEQIKFRPKIKSVRDCLYAMNNLLDKGSVIINSKTCKNFIADLEQCTLKQGGLELDKSNQKRTHWLDGFKDMAEYEFPIVKSYTHSREQRIR